MLVETPHTNAKRVAEASVAHELARDLAIAPGIEQHGVCCVPFACHVLLLMVPLAQ